VRPGLLALIILCCALVMGACVRRVHDYTFAVTGLVTAQDGRPLEDAEVTLLVDAPVYEGVTALKSQRLLTNGNGAFMFMYLTGNASTKYSLTIRKEGFEPQTLSGSSPPAAHHSIRLKKAEKTEPSNSR
jgi:Carboxypeptidase regulatory-like domain